VIEDSVEGESYMIRTVGQEVGTEEEDEPVPHRNVLTPVMESTPVEGHEKERGKLSFRSLTAPKKKMWVPAVPTEKELDDDEKSSSGDSSASRRSPLSVVSSGRRRVLENEVPLHLKAPRGYGDRATRVQLHFNERTGLREISATEEGDEIMTGGGDSRDLRVRRVTARSWLEGEESDEDTGIEDLDDQLFRLIDSTPRRWTVSRIFRIAVANYPDRAPWYLRSKISTLMLSMRRTA